MLEWLTVADDRTGALEVAGEMAPWLGPVTVTVRTPPPDVVAAVVDIGSRHAPVSVAAERAVVAAATPARRRAHKIDSLLRGNWAHELVAVQRASGGRVLLVAGAAPVGPGLPGRRGLRRWRPGRRSRRSAGRLVRRARPSTSWMPGRRTWSSSPTRRRCGAGSTEGGSFAVCDASSDEDLDAIAAVWSETGPPLRRDGGQHRRRRGSDRRRSRRRATR